MAKVACLELRLREGIAQEYAALKLQSLLPNKQSSVVVQDDELNITTEYKTEDELLLIGMAYGKLEVAIEQLCYAAFATTGG